MNGRRPEIGPVGLFMSCGKSRAPAFPLVPCPIRLETGFALYCSQHALLQTQLGPGLTLREEEREERKLPSGLPTSGTMSFTLQHTFWLSVSETSTMVSVII